MMASAGDEATGEQLPLRANVVLILADHHRWDYVGSLGNSAIRTPNLDALAARGTVVEGMYSTSPLCMPQRISITAGRY
jgi:choline-sulfatase